MTDYADLRHRLNRHPQTAGNESFAHDLIVAHLAHLAPTCVHEHVGGYGVVAYWQASPRHTAVAFRADTDALPSGHRCGHDGHTTILLRLAELVDSKLRQGVLHRNVVLVWQPAEETGEGAQAILDSGILQRYPIASIYGLHNLPGFPTATVVVCPRTFAAASVGVAYHLDGRQTHASTPELGLNPGLAVSEIISRFATFNSRGSADDFRQSTLICVNLGSPAFGTSAGHAEIMFTLRAFSNDTMEHLLAEAHATVADIASRHGLGHSYTLHDPFPATENHAEAVEAIEHAAESVPLRLRYQPQPFRWSEDFGRYLVHYRGAMFGIGSGERQPELHHPDFDFPDSLVDPAARLFLALAD